MTMIIRQIQENSGRIYDPYEILGSTKDVILF